MSENSNKRKTHKIHHFAPSNKHFCIKNILSLTRKNKKKFIKNIFMSARKTQKIIKKNEVHNHHISRPVCEKKIYVMTVRVYRLVSRFIDMDFIFLLATDFLSTISINFHKRTRKLLFKSFFLLKDFYIVACKLYSNFSNMNL